MAEKIPLMLNTNIIITPEDEYVCPKRDVFVNVLGKLKPNYVRVKDERKGVSIQKFDKVTLKDRRRRLVALKKKSKFIKKREGRTRAVLLVRDYSHPGNFDASANRVQRGEINQVCLPFPAIRTCQRATIAEGEFPIDNLTVK